MKRSHFLKSIAALAGAAAVQNPFAALSNPLSENSVPLRIAHLTDIHILPRKEAIEGTQRAIEKLNALNPLPDYVLFGGDNIMDALNTEKEKVKEMWKLFREHAAGNLKIPFASCIGNHDVFGWDMDASIKTDKSYGKQWAMDELKMPHRYFSFRKNKWKIIVLDSIHIGEGDKGYLGKLDEEQFEWLKGELHGAALSNILIISHIPVISVCPVFHPSSLKEAEKRFEVGAGWMHIDSMRIKNAFLESGNRIVCLSGHTHMQDRIEYNGTVYLNNGAVSGNWWNGKYQDFEPAFAVVELNDDGTCSRQWINY